MSQVICPEFPSEEEVSCLQAGLRLGLVRAHGCDCSASPRPPPLASPFPWEVLNETARSQQMLLC